MPNTEQDTDPYRQSEVRKLKNDISDLDSQIANLINKRRFLQQALSDLEYEMKTKS